MINAHQGGPETLAEAERFYTFLIKVLAPFHNWHGTFPFSLSN